MFGAGGGGAGARGGGAARSSPPPPPRPRPPVGGPRRAGGRAPRRGAGPGLGGGGGGGRGGAVGGPGLVAWCGPCLDAVRRIAVTRAHADARDRDDPVLFEIPPTAAREHSPGDSDPGTATAANTARPDKPATSAARTFGEGGV